MIQVLLIVLLVFLVGTGVFFLIREEQAHTRDAKRMADMARLSAGFFEMFATEGSYASAGIGCPEAGASVASCALSAYVPDIASFQDPTGVAYVVQGVPGEASFVISFTLERTYGVFVAGTHVLTPQGIQ